MKFSIKRFIKQRSLPFITENGKLVLQFIITALCIGLAFWFLKKERTELSNVKDTLVDADLPWLIAGILLALFYCFLQGLMYVSSFAAVNAKITIRDAVILFLKRNFISVFLPAGGVSSLVFYTREIEKKGITKTQTYFGSSIYGFVAILSVVIVAIPAFIFAMTRRSIGSSEWIALLAIVFLLLVFYYAYYLVSSRGKFYKWLVHRFPNIEVYLNEIQNSQTNKKQIAFTIIISVLIELVGIFHVYIAMLALHLTPSLFTSVMAYLVMVVFLIVSPFLRGFGAIEISMTYVLIRFGFSNVQSIATMLLFRFFEFWIPLVSGIISYFIKLDKLLMRILPSVLLFALGVVNIISVMTPSIATRVNFLKELLLPEIIYSSNILVLLTGLLLLAVSVFMLKGLRNAWWFAVVLTITSLIGHLTKGIDFEEATAALIVLLILVITHREYNIKTNPKLRTIGLQTSLLTVAAVLLYGIIGFYFLDKNHFHMDFNLWQSIRYTLQNFFLFGNTDLVPDNVFAKDFILSIKASGFLSIIFLVYTLIRPHKFSPVSAEEEILKTEEMLKNFGNSALDHFKTYPDKLLFWTGDKDAFLAYRIGGNYAVALENPVAPDMETTKKCIREFCRFCYENGLKYLFYRIPPQSLSAYKEFKMKSMFIGQEGIIDLDTFTLEGHNVKSIRNAVRKVTELEYRLKIYKPPQLGGTMQKLKAVSDEWLRTTGREEICFSQGIFDENELKNQVIIVVENKEAKIIAFLNIIPDYAKNEGTYDLLRKTADAPNGVVDFILVELFNYFRSLHIRYVNIGFTPMSKISNPQTFPEKSMKFVYEKLRSFSHFKGQREYKEKFGPVWFDRFLVYNHDYDLIQAPSVLSKVIRL